MTAETPGDCLARETLLDPSTWWRHARRKSPVLFEPRLNAWLVTRRDDVLRVLRDTETFSSAHNLPTSSARASAPYPWEAPTLANADRPEHTRMRKLASRAFSRRRIATLEPLIAEHAARLVDSIAPYGEADVVADLAWPLAEHAVAVSVGYPRAALDSALQAVRAFDVTTDPTRSEADHANAARAYARFVEVSRSLLDSGRDQPGEDLVATLANSKTTEAEAVSVLFQVTLAGLATSAHLTSHAVRLSLEPERDPRVLRTDEAAAGRIVEETLRHSGPVRAMERTTTRPVELGGTTLEAGAQLLVFFGSANRDEDFVADGDAFAPDRTDGRDHLAFGRGTHYCLGAELARMEAIAAIQAVAALREVELVPGQRYEPFPNPGIFGLRAVRVRWRAPRR